MTFDRCDDNRSAWSERVGRPAFALICSEGADVPLTFVGFLAARLLERVDDANALEVVESRHVLRVEDLHVGFDTRRENQGVPQRCSTPDMKRLRVDKIPLGRENKRQQILEVSQTIPRVNRGEALLTQLARCREKLAGDLPEQHAISGRW